jgi:hypothetical protein
MRNRITIDNLNVANNQKNITFFNRGGSSTFSVRNNPVLRNLKTEDREAYQKLVGLKSISDFN